jgi:hypothetical protein
MRHALTLATLLSIAGSACASGQTTLFQPIALTNQPAPGGGVFAFFDAPRHDAGTMAFVAVVTGVPANSQLRLFANSSGTNQLLARCGDPAPDIAGATLATLELQDLNAAGNLHVAATIEGPLVGQGTQRVQYLGSTSSGLSLAARLGQQIPGLAPGVRLSWFTNQSSLNARGHTAIHTTIAGPGIVPNVNDTALLLLQPGVSPRLVAQGNDPIPGMPNASIQGPGWELALGDDDVVGFIGGLALNGSLIASSTVLLAGTDRDRLSPIAINGQLEPALDNASLEIFENLRPAAQGGFNFDAYAVGGICGDDFAQTSCSTSSGQLRVKLFPSQPPIEIPETTTQFTFRRRGVAADAGISGFDGPGVNELNNTYLWVSSPGRTEVLAREGRELPGFPGSFCANLPTGAIFDLDDTGWIFAQIGFFDASGTPRNAFYVWSPAEGLRLIASTRQQFEVEPGITRTIAALSISDRFPDAEGRLAVRLDFTDSTGGIFMTLPAGDFVCDSDYNVDGGVDGSDVEAFFGDFEDGIIRADLNGDGGVDGGDVEAFFIHFEAGC